MSYQWDPSIVCPKDPTATPERIAQYEQYYRVKHEIAAEVNPSSILEIGVRAGYSAWAFLTACPDALYIGLDAENGMHGGQGGPWGWWAERILSQRKFTFHILKMDTQKVEELPASASLFHVDGDHSEEGVFHDLELCFQAARKGAAILVDDYDYEQAPGVRPGVDRWLEERKRDVTWEHRASLRGEILIRVK